MTVNYSAIFQTVNNRLGVTILDVTAQGAKLATPRAIEAGLSARLFIDGHEVYCTVRWANDRQCGLKFADELPQDALDKVLETSSEEIVPVACAHMIPMGRKRDGKLVYD